MIRVKAMGLLVHNGGVLASWDRDRVKQQDYLRLIGGSVEFGERSEDALRREFMEELGAELCDVWLLSVAENVYIYEGRPGHEVVFIYGGRFRDEAFYERAALPFIEPGATQSAVWTPADDILEGRAILYPVADYAALIREASARLA